MQITSESPSLSAKAGTFLASVLELNPRLAAFDCDGTLWSGDAGESFFRWEMERGLVSPEIAAHMRARHDDYRAGKVSEDDMCGEMVTMNRGIAEAEMIRAAHDFFEQKMSSHIFADMHELVRRLSQAGCELWAVSSTNDWVIKAGMAHFDIPATNVLAASVHIEDRTVTDRLVRMPSGEGKVKVIREVVKRDPEAVFGNSRWDAAMLSIARNPFAINPNPDLETMARAKNWPVYFPDAIAERK